MNFKTDKFQWGFVDEYIKYIDFKNINSLLEIGIYKGESLFLWSHLTNDHAKIVGIDIIIPEIREDKKIEMYEINQKDTKSLIELTKKYDFDVVIDDGSHLKEDSQNCFENIFPLLKSGSWYVIEDWGTRDKNLMQLHNYVLYIEENKKEYNISESYLIDRLGQIAFFKKGCL